MRQRDGMSSIRKRRRPLVKYEIYEPSKKTRFAIREQ